ncbi:6,7-dimethyl-8-ribityllumazine synthase [Acetivibrio straminisolvens JCM 21531]|uniref:6,7-dimethyl-8-ribityllumazine synthase n=1 Tax=Acetivibrio straminisolvens JCM 21531 TaxID=1294263 RepID=W4VC62_9FIRM|nr:6,7-dimethyl-8-ribityllumazine synthase [Acetivibrio straminisolvens JCM 21531]
MAIKTNEGKLIASGLKFGVVVGRFNEFISSKLLGGVIDGLVRHGASEEDIEISWVPGAFEIPLVAQKMANSKKFDALFASVPL